ncbi:acid protease [Trichodelitschia bisporula]|uniref:Acid protease n=1 Tax=Trichodelitschia bisporula TaxID=703511 RepID=A0A6G1I0D3_9PEZI|nr:acid protease [Trichodelitschia bisporula]
MRLLSAFLFGGLAVAAALPEPAPPPESDAHRDRPDRPPGFPGFGSPGFTSPGFGPPPGFSANLPDLLAAGLAAVPGLSSALPGFSSALLQALINGPPGEKGQLGWVLNGLNSQALQFRIAKAPAVAFQPPSPDVVTQNVLPLIRRPGTSLSRRYISLLRAAPYVAAARTEAHENATPPPPHAAPLADVLDTVYLVPITLGTQRFQHVVDTGSSDTWVIGHDFKCIDPLSGSGSGAGAGLPASTPHTAGSAAAHGPGTGFLPPASCAFGPAYTRATSTTAARLPATARFNISYADGEFLTGTFAAERVTLAGLTLPAQAVAIVDTAYWSGDGHSSGLLGLAYPNLTRAFAPGTWPARPAPYNPLFTSMWQANLTAPLFSLALSRRANAAGVLALGGLPPPPVRWSRTWARAPLEYLTLTLADGSTRRESEYQLYMISAEGFALGPPADEMPAAPTTLATSVRAATPKLSAVRTVPATGTRAPLVPVGTGKTGPTGGAGAGKAGGHKLTRLSAVTQFAVDSGTTLMYTHADLARTVAGLFDPPGWTDASGTVFLVQCGARAPQFSVRIGGVDFWVNGKDMVQDAGGRFKGSGIGGAAEGPICVSA